MKFFKLWPLLFLLSIIIPGITGADCGSIIYLSDVSNSSLGSSSSSDPPVNAYSVRPDFIVKKIWLEDANGNAKTSFKPGEQIRAKGTFKNVGTNSPQDVKVKFYLSNGHKVDSNKQQVGSTDNIRDYNLESGESQSECRNLCQGLQESGVLSVMMVRVVSCAYLKNLSAFRKNRKALFLWLSLTKCLLILN